MSNLLESRTSLFLYYFEFVPEFSPYLRFVLSIIVYYSLCRVAAVLTSFASQVLELWMIRCRQLFQGYISFRALLPALQTF